MMAIFQMQAAQLFDKINATDTRLFYIKTPIEKGGAGETVRGAVVKPAPIAP
jgi:hypothetical protein